MNANMMTKLYVRLQNAFLPRKSGMELVQVAILIAIAITIGLVFKKQIGKFVDNVFSDLLSSDF